MIRKLIFILFALSVNSVVFALEKQYITYNTNRTDVYFSEILSSTKPTNENSKALAKLMQAEVLELAEKDWGHWMLYSGDGWKGVRRAFFNCPDEMLLALANAAPLLDNATFAKAKTLADKEFNTYPPWRHPWTEKHGNSRSSGNTDRMKSDYPIGPGFRGGDIRRLNPGFRTFYGIWAYAQAFNRWGELAKHWNSIRTQRRKPQVSAKLNWQPKWKSPLRQKQPKVLTRAKATTPYYLFRARQFLLNTVRLNHHRKVGDQDDNEFRYFSYPKLLSSLIGYARIARHFSDKEEVNWAREQFNRVASQTFKYDTAPFYWSSAWLTPEVGRLIREHAAEFLILAQSAPTTHYADYKDGFGTKGPYVLNSDPYSWQLSRIGSNGYAFPSIAMGGFLTNAYLFKASAQKLDRLLDIPWCPADYWYIQKCAVTIQAYEGAKWKRLKGW